MSERHEKHYAPCVRARQEQLEADVRRAWQTYEPQQGVHGAYTEKEARVIPFKSRRKNGGELGVANGQGADLVILESDPARDLMAFSRIKVTLDEDTSLFIDRKASTVLSTERPADEQPLCDLREPVCEPTDQWRAI